MVCRWCVVGVSLVCHWCVVGVSLVCRWCVTDLSLSYSCSWSLVRRSSICSSVWSCVCSSQVCLSLVRHSSLSRVSHESLTGLSVRSSLVCLLVQLLGSWSLPRGLPLVFHRSVVGHGRSCICSFVARCSARCSARCFPVCCSVTSLSARVMVAGLLIRWWSAVRASLAMVVDLLLMHLSLIHI